MRIKTLLVSGVIGIASLSISNAENLIKNPSFEESDTSSGENTNGDRAENWGRWGHWINRETGWTPVRTGKSIIGYHHWEIPDDNTSGLYQDIPDLPAGSKCTFSVYVSKDEKANADSIEMRLETVNGGKTLASQTYSFDQIKSSWTKVSVTGSNPEEGIRVLLMVTPKKGGGRDGALRIDDADLTVE